MAYNHHELFWAANKGDADEVEKWLKLKPAVQDIDELEYGVTILFNLAWGSGSYPFSSGSYRSIILLLLAGANPYQECNPEELDYPSNPFLAAIYRGDLALARLMVMANPNYEHLIQFLKKSDGQANYPTRKIFDTFNIRDDYEVSKGKPKRDFASAIAETATDAVNIRHQQMQALGYMNRGDLIKAAQAYEIIITLYAKQAKLEMTLVYYKPREFRQKFPEDYAKDVTPDVYRPILRNHYLALQRSYLSQLYIWYAQIEEHLQNNSATATQGNQVYHVYVLGRLIEIGGALSLTERAVLNTYVQREIALRDMIGTQTDFSSIPEGPEGIIFTDRASASTVVHETDEEDIGLTSGRPKRGSDTFRTVLNWFGFRGGDTSTAEEKYGKDH